MTTALRQVTPAFANFPAYTETLGPEVADLATMAGLTPDPEQELALNAAPVLGALKLKVLAAPVFRLPLASLAVTVKV